MRVFSQINNCQQKQKQKNKNKNKKADKTKKRGGPLLGLAKSIYYGDEFVVYHRMSHKTAELLTKDGSRARKTKKGAIPVKKKKKIKEQSLRLSYLHSTAKRRKNFPPNI